MQRYKDFPIRISAISTQQRTWLGRAVVLDPQSTVYRQIHRVETDKDFVFLTKEEAEQFALKLCKAWIDRSAVYRTL